MECLHAPPHSSHPHLNFICTSSHPKRSFSRVTKSSHPRQTACLLGQFNDCQRQSLQPTAGVSSNIINRLSASFQRGTRIGNPEMEQQLRIFRETPLLCFLFYTKLLSFTLILHKAFQLYLFLFFFIISAPPKEHPL